MPEASVLGPRRLLKKFCAKLCWRSFLSLCTTVNLSSRLSPVPLSFFLLNPVFCFRRQLIISLVHMVTVYFASQLSLIWNFIKKCSLAFHVYTVWIMWKQKLVGNKKTKLGVSLFKPIFKNNKCPTVFFNGSLILKKFDLNLAKASSSWRNVVSIIAYCFQAPHVWVCGMIFTYKNPQTLIF